MRVFITGGTGLIGRRLTLELLERGDRPVILSRRADRVRLRPALREVELVQGDPTIAGPWDKAVDGCDAVVNLAGENLFAGRWNPEVKRSIRDSRVHATEQVVEALRKANKRPSVLVQGSAIGYYGSNVEDELTESSPPGTDFMAKVCQAWEAAAALPESFGVRLAVIRTGVVLAKGEGALGAMTPVFKWLPGGAAPVGGGDSRWKPGLGRQWMSWIHLKDVVGTILLALDHADARGPINATSPQAVRNADFARALAKVLRRPFLPVGPPDALLNLVLGEVAEVVTKGQKVLPMKALNLGYSFQFPDLADALHDIFAKPGADAKGESKVKEAGVAH
ncbi:MAG: TIGR01777 family oxidoreductase [Isosphaeraceae bacterium]